MPIRKSPKKAAAKKVAHKRVAAKKAAKKAPAQKLGTPVAPPTFKAYMLRTCAADMSSHSGFVWPESGRAVCPDWKPKAECGNGLHGLLWGAGDGSLLNWDENAKWLVVGIDEWVEIGGKVKAPEGHVVFTGDRSSAAEMLMSLGADRSKMILGQATASGWKGQATASGWKGQATASGSYGQATASGDQGQALAGIGGRAAADSNGILAIRWWDTSAKRVRLAVTYVGESGIEPKRFYTVNEKGSFVATNEFVQETSNVA